MLDVSLTQTQPRIIQVTLSGVLSHAEAVADGQFAEVIARLQGAPFRVVCDFRRMSAMSPEVADLFAQAQAFAIQQGMVRDAFVSPSRIVRLQLARLASESSRLSALGPLRFFDTLEQAYAHVLSRISMPVVEPATRDFAARKLG